MSAEQHFKKAMDELSESLQFIHSLKRVIVAAGLTRRPTQHPDAMSALERVENVEAALVRAQGELRGLLHVLSQTASVAQSAADGTNLHRATVRKFLEKLRPYAHTARQRVKDGDQRAELDTLLAELDDHLRAS